jgi:hypothetical protein
MRQIHLVAALAASLFKCLDAVRPPSHIRWIRDRDAMFDRHDAIAFDLAHYYFLLLRSQDSVAVALERPDFIFALPGMDGIRQYEELIQLPDCLAGTIADIDVPAMQFSDDKFLKRR